MCRELTNLTFCLVLVLVLTAGTAMADPLQQDPDPNGIVCVEAENFDENTPRPPHTWELITVAASGFAPPNGFTGGYAMQSTPTTPAGGAGPDAPADFLANSPRLDYEVNFIKTGTHYVWVLAWGLDGNSDSLHSGLDGQHVPTADRITGFGNNYRWTNTAYQDPERIMIDVTSAGVHTFNIWMREDGSVVDKILLTTNPNYTPTGAGPEESWRGPRLQAYNPIPADGTLHTDTWASLSWTPGETAVSHDVYFGENFADVNNGAGDIFRGNQPGTFFVVGFPGFPYPNGLVPGTTYYWRIDEVEAVSTTKHKGDVWSFSIPSNKAHDPTPPDGAKFMPTNVTLSWTAGFGSKLHHVYFGDNFDTVSNAAGALPQAGTTFTPGVLQLEKTYYWRVDEFSGTAMFKGDVWSFTTTISGLGTAIAERWNNIATTDLNALKNDPRYPNNPDVTETVTQFSWDGPDTDNYGGRIHGWLYVPATGDYTFWLNTDDQGELWLSTDDDSSNVKLIARESTYTTVNTWGAGEEQSKPVSLAGGQKYYIMALWKEGTGGDHCQVAWRGPGIPVRMIIPGANLSAYRPLSAYGASPTNGATNITQTPTLVWKPGLQAASHEVYFGTDAQVVAGATKASSEYKGAKARGSESYNPGKLAWETTYYWRVDEVNNTNPASPWVGSVWSFTTAGFAIIDDFESYDAAANQIWYAWHDGLGYGVPTTPPYFAGNGTGAAVGDETTASFTEETIVHGGRQSMPLAYDNNKQGFAKYSEAELTLTAARDWTDGAVTELSVWFRGRAGSVGSFVEGPVGTYTMTASGADIWNQADQFHFAYKTLSGAGSIEAQVLSVDNTDPWAKAGVMIRETLDAGSKFAAVYITPANGCRFQARATADAAATSDTAVVTPAQTAITAPYWVKIERDVAGNFKGYYSSNGTSWTPMTWNPQSITMGSNVYIGLVLTSHNNNATCTAKFSGVKTAGTVSPQWANQDIGIISNAAEPLYVAVSNAAGQPAVVVHTNPNAATTTTWTEWVIPLSAFADKGINLKNVDRLAIGLGTRGNMTAPGGSGKMYFDDIRLYRPRTTP